MVGLRAFFVCLLGLALTLSNGVRCAYSFEYQFPVFRVILTPNVWDVERIKQEAELRRISILEESDDARGEYCATEWSTEYLETFQLRDRMKLAGFDAEIEKRMVDYREAKDMFPLEEFATYTDLGEYAPASFPASLAEVEAIQDELISLGERPGVATKELVHFLEDKVPTLLAAEEAAKAQAQFLIGAYYYHRAMAISIAREENFRPGVHLRQYDSITSEENRSYLTALQHFRASAKLESPIQERAYYHCASSLYGLRELENKLTRIPQALDAYQEYLERYPDGTWANRAAMNIVGLEIELSRLDRQRPIGPAIAKAQEVLFRAGNDVNEMGYEELRCAWMIVMMKAESGDDEAALDLYETTFGLLDTERLAESLYSTYSTAVGFAAMLYANKGEFQKAGDMAASIVELCTKPEHFMQGSLEANLNRFRWSASEYYKSADMIEEAQKYEVGR